jgi:hypothetical protein
MIGYDRMLTYSTADGTQGASISDCGKYRYDLWRRWDAGSTFVKFIMLNPSTADHKVDDPTIRKCIKFAKSWGYGGVKVVNLFAFRATNPKKLKALGYAKAVGPCNNTAIIEALSSAGPNIAAWGQGGKLFSRGLIVRHEILVPRGIQLQALKISKDGTPWHPLYLRDDSIPFFLVT